MSSANDYFILKLKTEIKISKYSSYTYFNLF